MPKDMFGGTYLNEPTQAILCLGRHGIVLSAQNSSKVTGWHQNELTGKTFHSLLTSPYREHYEALIVGFWNDGNYEKVLDKRTRVELEHKEEGSKPFRLSIHKQGDMDRVMLVAFLDEEKDAAVLITTNCQGTIVTANNVEDTFGYRMNELNRNHIGTVLPFSDFHTRNGPVESEVRQVIGRHKTGFFFHMTLITNSIKVGEFYLYPNQLIKIDDSQECFFTVDNNGIIMDMNHKAITNVLGYKHQELIGKKFAALTPIGRSGSSGNTAAATLAASPSISGGNCADVDPPATDTSPRKRARTNEGLMRNSSDLSIEGSGDFGTYPDYFSSTSVDSCKAGPLTAQLYHKDNSLIDVKIEVYPFERSLQQWYSLRIYRSEMSSGEQRRLHKVLGGNGSPVNPRRHRSASYPENLRASVTPMTPVGSITMSPLTPMTPMMSMMPVTPVMNTHIKDEMMIQPSLTIIDDILPSLLGNSSISQPSELESYGIDPQAILDYFSQIELQSNTTPMAQSTPTMPPPPAIVQQHHEINSEIPSKKMKLLNNQYLALETIGTGSSGKVKRGIDTISLQQVAIKIIPKTQGMDLERARRETDIMMKLDHPNIVKLLKVFENEKKMYIVMEFVAGTDLMAYVLKNKGLSEMESREIFRQLVWALKYCHSSGVVHRDVKNKNIMLDANHNVKLIDFGLSSFHQDGVLKSSYCGTPGFASPEIILGKRYEGTGADIWSAGVVLFCMLTAQFPYTNMEMLLLGTYKDPVNVSQECCSLLRRMMERDPARRANIDEVMRHPWLMMTR